MESEILIHYFLIISSIIISGFSLTFVKKRNKYFIKHLLTFSGAFLLGLIFNVLLPEIYQSSKTNISVLFIFLGFIVQLFLDFLTRGLEHGHDHECNENHNHTEHHGITAIGLMMGLCIHSFIEGIPINKDINEHIREHLIKGIILHNIPISLVITSLFISSGFNKKKILFLLGIFSIMTPLGSLISNFSKGLIVDSLNDYNPYILSFVVGIFLHVSTSVLFEAGEEHKYNLQKILTLILGIGLTFFLEH